MKQNCFNESEVKYQVKNIDYREYKISIFSHLKYLIIKYRHMYYEMECKIHLVVSNEPYFKDFLLIW